MCLKMFPSFKHSISLAYPEVKPYKKHAYGRPFKFQSVQIKGLIQRKTKKTWNHQEKNQEQQGKIQKSRKNNKF